MLIIAGISIQAITNTGLFVKAKESKEKSIKSQATETMNLKITTIEISSYIENTKLPTLQYLANKLCEDNDMEYVLKASKKNASLNKIDVGDVTSICIIKMIINNKYTTSNLSNGISEFQVYCRDIPTS